MDARIGFVDGIRGGQSGRRGGGGEVEADRRAAVGAEGDMAVLGTEGRLSVRDSWFEFSCLGWEVHAPVHASRRCTYVARPSFHNISFLSRRWRLRLRVMTD